MDETADCRVAPAAGHTDASHIGAVNNSKMSYDHRQDRRGRRPAAAGAASNTRLLLLFSYATLCALSLNPGGHRRAADHRHKHQAAAGLRPLIGLAAATPQVSTLGGNSNNLYQALSQMFQVFSGNDSSQLDANHFKLLELADEDTLLVGARNVVYNLSLTTLREQRRLVWMPEDEDLRLCKIKGKTSDQCQNYIRVIKRPSPDTLLVCGTNAFKPKCHHYTIGRAAYELTAVDPGEGACPYQESQNVTSTFADGQLFSATAAQFNGIDHLIHRTPLRTEQFNPKQLSSPNFVSSFRYGDHVYFLFREVAVEHINCGKTIYSRIARVCVNDQGGATTRNRWTSFAKARLNCSIPGEFPFYFDEIQASTHVVQSAYLQPAAAPGAAPSQDLVYAVFTTPTNSIGGSAVCAYRMADVLAAFEGPFKTQADATSYWLPVPDSKVPQPRPGNCAADSKRLPEDTINFIKDNPLMDTAVAPVWSQPLITMASINFRFTQIAVDPQVESAQVSGAGVMRTDVIFVATDDGRVLKLINSYHLAASHQVHKLLAASSPPGAAPSPLLSTLAASQQQPPPQQLQSMPLVGGAAGGFGLAPTAPHRPLAQVGTGGAPAKPADPLPDVSANTVVIEELHLFDQRTPITGMLIHRPPPEEPANELGQQPPLLGQGKLVVMSSKQIKAIPLSRCERAATCTECLALYDPYCVWDLHQQACLAAGRSAAPAAGPADPYRDQYAQLGPAAYQQFRLAAAGRPPTQAQPAWHPSLYQQLVANNHTLAWWSSAAACPTHSSAESGPQPAGPYRSLFASHLQVPSRFDYQSGHHLSRTSLVALPQMAPISSTAAAGPSHAGGRPQQPVSECLTLCGGVYAPPVGAATSDSYLQQQTCADYFASASNSLLLLNGQQQNLYTSENLKWAVIICALAGVLLGFAFGFAFGKSARSKQESSICSSTFDETNLYMASTGSHGCHMAGNGLFAPMSNHHHHQSSTVARLASHPAFIASQQQQHQQQQRRQDSSNTNTNNYSALTDSQAAGAGHQAPLGRGQPAAMFEATQSLLGVASDHSSGIGSSTYANQHQHQLFHAGPAGHERSPSVRTGALPPIPGGAHQPLVLAGQAQTTHLNQAQLTPNSSTASQQTSTGSSSGSQSTLQAGEQQQQQFFLSHQLAGQNGGPPNGLHQRSFTNSSAGSGKQTPLLAGKQQVANSTFLQPAQQPSNKIYL